MSTCPCCIRLGPPQEVGLDPERVAEMVRRINEVLKEDVMGDYRVTVEAVGGHGCGREAKDGEKVVRCGATYCPDCAAIEFVAKLKNSGNSVYVAKLEHWPVPGAAGTTRTENPGPVDDLLTGVRAGSFGNS